MICGGAVYCITNALSGKRYVGATTRSLAAQWGDYRRLSRLPRTDSRQDVFLDAVRQFGEDAFEISVLAVAETAEEMQALERRYIAELGTLVPNGYNVALGGWGEASFSRSTRLKMSRTRKALEIPPEQREKMRVGRIAAIEAMRNGATHEEIRAANLARKIEARRRKARPRPPVSQEKREKLSAAKLGRKFTPEHRAKIAAAVRAARARKRGDLKESGDGLFGD